MKNHIKILGVLLLFSFSACNREEEKKECCSSSDSLSAVSGELSGESLYQLTGIFTTEENETLELDQLRGKVQVVSMIFSHCEYACPRLVSDMQMIEESIPEDKRDDVNFLLVSFDVERDSPERLKEFKISEKLGSNWKLLHGEESLVRMLSVLLNIKYEKQSDGNFAHSNIITVLDRDGVVRSRVEGLGADPAPAVKAINDILK